MKLSTENYNKLKEGCLYKKQPIIDNSFSVGTVSGTYHCKNWTFTIYKNDGRAWSSDTYFGERYEEVTDDNINDYTFIFSFDNVQKIPDECIDEYDKDDLFCVATDSGGYSCGHLHWIRKGTLKSKHLLLAKKEDEIRKYKNRIDSLERDVEKIKNGSYYEKLKQ